MTDPPIRFKQNPSTIRKMQPQLGQHSREILIEAGYSEKEINNLLEAKVIAEPH
jgi:formyl-CoA transferase